MFEGAAIAVVSFILGFILGQKGKLTEVTQAATVGGVIVTQAYIKNGLMTQQEPTKSDYTVGFKYNNKF